MPIQKTCERPSDWLALNSKKGDQDGALKLLQQLWEADKESIVRPEITAALLFNEAKDKKQAARLLKLAADRDPEKESTQIFVAQWALENGDLDYAQQCVDRAMLASKSSLQSRLLAALVARYRKENELAREMLESVHLESPRNLAAVIELAIVLSQIEGMEASFDPVRAARHTITAGPTAAGGPQRRHRAGLVVVPVWRATASLTSLATDARGRSDQCREFLLRRLDHHARQPGGGQEAVKCSRRQRADLSRLRQRQSTTSIRCKRSIRPEREIVSWREVR